MSEENKMGEECPKESEMPETVTEPERVAAESDAPQVDTRCAFGAATTEHSEQPQPTEKRKKEKRISIPAFLLSSVALVLAAVMVTFACCAGFYKQKLADAQLLQAKYYPFELFNVFLSEYSMEETDEDEMLRQALKAYIAATGDEYAVYYTAEEYRLMLEANAGDSEGIGINIINETYAYEGVTYAVFYVINVNKNSPAEAAGLTAGDRIFAVGNGADATTITELGYDVALARLKGAAGTEAKFRVFRTTEDDCEIKDFSVTRGKVTTTSVYSHRSEQSPDVGIVKIVQFDLTTPVQFSEAVDALKAQGCDKFVFDVRYNPGGDLRSIEAVLSYFLEKDDVIVRTEDAQGNWEISRVKEVSYAGSYADCNVSKEDIGKYRGLSAVVLCNESTASAAELFAATFRDYELGTLVGTTTFGKGSMQTTFSLEPYYSGALKLTTAKYYPAKGDNYHGVGIEPHVTVELGEEAAKKNVYLLTDEEDNQLQKALEQFGVQK